MGGTKLERFLPKNQQTQRKSLNFENWVNGEDKVIYTKYSKHSNETNTFMGLGRAGRFGQS